MSSAETLWALARAVLIGLLLAILLLRLFEERLVFFPNQFATGEWDPAAHGVQAEDVYFTTSDGLRLHGWLAPTKEGWASESTPTILYFHGNAGNLTNRIDNIGFLQQLGLNVLAVDYRGFGKSEGRPTEEGIYRDAEAAYDYLVRERGLPPERLVVLGQSLGVAVAVDLATKRKVAGLILEAGFPSARRVVARAMWLPGLQYIIRSKFDSAAKLKQIRVPVLVAHCRQDSVLPFVLGEELYAAANEPKKFVPYPGDCHEPLYLADPADYAARLRNFLGEATEAPRHRE
ncbi:MAG: alpha/beta hydrolase [Terriglobia bacterium]